MESGQSLVLPNQCHPVIMVSTPALVRMCVDFLTTVWVRHPNRFEAYEAFSLVTPFFCLHLAQHHLFLSAIQEEFSSTTGANLYYLSSSQARSSPFVSGSGGQAREVPHSQRQTASTRSQPARLTPFPALTQLSADAITPRLEPNATPANAMRCRARHPKSGALHETYSPPQRADIRVRTLEGADWRARKSSARRALTANKPLAFQRANRYVLDP